MAIASLWGDIFGAMILAGFTRMVLNHHFTFCINSFCHMLGTQPYSDQNSARDSWFMALFTYGEGYHNFHHKFPSDYRNGIKNYHWDPTKWLIKLLSYLGLTHSLRQISDQKILLAKIRMDEKRLVRRLAGNEAPTPLVSQELVATARLKFEKAYVRFHELKGEYEKLKKEKLAALSHHLSHFNERIEFLKQELLKAREALIEAMAAWRDLCHNVGIRPTLAAV
jgi:stearoyl-CoA desaturase (delta-9 desaturase)